MLGMATQLAGKEIMMGILLEAAAVIGLLGRYCFANRGMLPFFPGIRIFEPKQRALIAWDGEEEILLLSTDVRASKATQVLEVLPLPSEPAVKKGKLALFWRIQDLISRKLWARRPPSLGVTRDTLGVMEPPAGKVTFHERIGAHDISVAQVLRRDGFVTWVEGYLQDAGVENPDLPAGLEGIIEDYIQRGFSWFVFDAVSLDEDLKTNEPIQYRFKTSALFYPLVITSLGEGDTDIELFVLTKWPLRYFAGLPHYRVRVQDKPVEVTPSELRSVDRELGTFMGNDDNSVLRVWRLEGSLSSFQHDLLASNEAPFWRRLLQVGINK